MGTEYGGGMLERPSLSYGHKMRVSGGQVQVQVLE